MSEEAVKIAVLEQKLLDFSNIVKKLDDAIEKIGEANSNVIKMLAVHDERIEQCNRSDDLIVKMIDSLSENNEKDHKQVMGRVKTIEQKVEEIDKIKWMTIGCGSLIVVLIGAFASFASGWWTPTKFQHQHQIERSI